MGKIFDYKGLILFILWFKSWPVYLFQLSKDDFTLFGGVFGNKQDSAFKNLEVGFKALFDYELINSLPKIKVSQDDNCFHSLSFRLRCSPLPPHRQWQFLPWSGLVPLPSPLCCRRSSVFPLCLLMQRHCHTWAFPRLPTICCSSVCLIVAGEFFFYFKVFSPVFWIRSFNIFNFFLCLFL